MCVLLTEFEPEAFGGADTKYFYQKTIHFIQEIELFEVIVYK